MEHLEKVLDERNNFLEKIAINNIKVDPPCYDVTGIWENQYGN